MASVPQGSIIRGEHGDYGGGSHHGKYAPCSRCGRVRAVKPGTSDMCRDCRWVDPKFGQQSYR